MRFALIIGALLMLVQAGAASAQRVGSAVEGLPGAVWVDSNSDGIADGYVLDGKLYAGSPASQGTQQAAPQWGFLAEMAERDWVYSGLIDCVVAARWEVPNRRLTFSQWSAAGSLVTSFELDPATGQLTLQFTPDSKPEPLTIAADGSINIERTGEQLPFGRKRPDGTYWFRYPNGTKWVYRPLAKTDSKYARLGRVIAQGKAREADPTITSRVASAQPMVAPPQTSAPQTLVATTVQSTQSPPTSPISPGIAAAAASTGPRYALIIGNSQYGASLGRLPNPANDAQSVASALRAVGFDVDLVVDADQKGMKRAISRFGERLSSARGATGLFYYAGHGIQSRGTNYLIPVSAPIEREADLDLEAVAADTVLAQMEDAGAATSIVILDACRNMPLARSFRSSSRGLARMDAPNGSFIAYSTAPGATAADGDGRNSPFAAALVKQIGQKGTPIEVVFRGVRLEVVQATGGEQTPWDSSSLLHPFYFAP